MIGSCSSAREDVYWRIWRMEKIAYMNRSTDEYACPDVFEVRPD